MNKVILYGHLGQDPELKYTTSGTAVVNLTLATNFQYKNKEGEQIKITEWHRLTAFGKLAEIIAKYTAKGAPFLVTDGRLQTTKWQDKDGHDRWTTQVIIKDMQLVSSGGKESTSSDRPPVPPADAQAPANDLPF